jgi:hypothetical protein
VTRSVANLGFEFRVVDAFLVNTHER